MAGVSRSGDRIAVHKQKFILSRVRPLLLLEYLGCLRC